MFVARNFALRRKGYDPRISGEITPLFCVSEFNSVAGMTAQSCHVFLFRNHCRVQTFSVSPRCISMKLCHRSCG